MQLNSPSWRWNWIRFNQSEKESLEHKKWKVKPSFNRNYSKLFDFKVKDHFWDYAEKEPESVFPLCASEIAESWIWNGVFQNWGGK